MEEDKVWLRGGNIARFVESVGAWIHDGGTLSALAWALNVKTDWIRQILVSAGLAGVDDRPSPNTCAQDVINVILLYYVAVLLQRTRGVRHA